MIVSEAKIDGVIISDVEEIVKKLFNDKHDTIKVESNNKIYFIKPYKISFVKCVETSDSPLY